MRDSPPAFALSGRDNAQPREGWARIARANPDSQFGSSWLLGVAAEGSDVVGPAEEEADGYKANAGGYHREDGSAGDGK